ncbi:MAG: HAMP domain-containing protein [Dehalococcoidia bacterium]|jgi:sensor domain CHASE-containing protein|nr:HAMP domain-containing protein [Dehalococcoidia bacterium]
MTVRAKAVALVTGLVCVGLVAVHLLAHIVLIPTYASLESRFVRADAEQALRALDVRLSMLDATCHDWASWDYMYEFAATRSPDFVAANLVDTSFETLELHVIVVLDASGDTLFAGAVDLETGEAVEVPNDLMAHVTAGSSLFDEAAAGSGAAGVLSLSQGAMLFSSRPILTTGDGGPSRGLLLMARFLDAQMTDEVCIVTGMPLSISALHVSSLDGAIAPSADAAGYSDIVVTPRGADLIEGSAIVADVYGEPALQVTVSRARDIYAEGQNTLSFFLAIMALSGLLLAVMALVLADRTVFRRLSRLASEVRAIGEQPDFRGTVSVSGDDEISFLAGTINDTLAALAETHQQLRHSHVELEATTIDLRRAQQDLGSTANRLKRLTRHLQSMREDERAVVATEIHDQVGQGLAALKMDLSAVEKSVLKGQLPATGLLQQMSGVLNELTDTVRRLSTGLHPNMLEDLGLAEAIEWHLGEFGKGKAVRTSLRIQGEVGGVEASRALTLFRILQEALLVSSEDPSVTEVTVTLTIESRYALLAIQDNGVAVFEGDALSRREMGLGLIRERVDVYGGGVTISTTPGAGTTVVAQIPL